MYRKTTKSWITIILLALFITGGYVVYSSFMYNRVKRYSQPQGRVFTVYRGDISFGINGSGVIQESPAMNVVIGVRSLDINKIKIGQEARIWVNQMSTAFDAEVSSISSGPRLANGGTLFDTTVTVKNNSNIKKGMTAEVQIVLTTKRNVLAIPAQAVQEDANGDKYVWILPSTWEKDNSEDTVPAKRQVKIGLMDERNAEVTDGLLENEKVVIQPQL